MKKMEKIYYDPQTGYTGIKDLMRKTKLGKRKVETFLQKQETYTRHKPVVRRHPTRKVYVEGIDAQFQADLVDMKAYRTKNKYFNYILNVIDCFSKYAWAIPIKKKTGNEITTAFQTLFTKSKRIPKRMHTDRGTEFINKSTQNLFKTYNIHWFATENTTKAQIVERFNKTLKDRMHRYFTANNTTNWIKVLPQLMENYNNSIHRSIKMTPVEASLTENETLVRNNLYGEVKKIKLKRPKYKLGDLVRISIKSDTFTRGYTPNYTKEVFEIVAVLDTRPTTYKLKDLKGEDITGAFYEQELSKVLNL